MPSASIIESGQHEVILMACLGIILADLYDYKGQYSEVLRMDASKSFC